MAQPIPEHAQEFFSPWEAPPPFVASPADAKRAEVLSKLAQYAAKNGASFVELIKLKQKDNAEYSFLFGGEHSDYYRWALYCAVHGLPVDQPLAQQPAGDNILSQCALSCNTQCCATHSVAKM